MRRLICTIPHLTIREQLSQVANMHFHRLKFRTRKVSKLSHLIRWSITVLTTQNLSRLLALLLIGQPFLHASKHSVYRHDLPPRSEHPKPVCTEQESRQSIGISVNRLL